MDRPSARTNPRQDDQMEHEEHALLHGHPDEGRTEPRRGEAPGPGEDGSIGTRGDVDDEGHATAPSQRVLDERAALAAVFPPSVFPAGRDRLVEEAEARFADDELIETLRTLPDLTYPTVGTLWEALGGDRPGQGPR